LFIKIASDWLWLIKTEEVVIMYEIKNAQYSVEIDPFGGIIGRITDLRDGEILTFQGDSEYWNHSDHVMFPWVCRMADGYYEVDGQKFQADIHGFAKDSDFSLIDKTDCTVTLGLTASAETKRVYPYEFELRVSYGLAANKLQVRYTVTNTDGKTIYFGIGAHPSFTLDGENGDTNGNFLILPEAEYVGYKVDKKNVLLLPESSFGTLSTIELSKSFFAEYDTLLVQRRGKSVKLVRRCGKTVTVECESPIIAVWSHPSKGNYVCIESFWGLPDLSGGVTRELKDKKYINDLEAGKSKCFGYDIIFN